MYRRLLIPVDVDEPSSWAKALPTAVTLARCYSAHLTLATVIPAWTAIEQAQWFPAALRELADVARGRLASLAETTGLERVDTRVAEGSIHRGILDIADEIKADLIILAAHRPGLREYLIGANAERLVRHARCSVMVVRE